MSPTVAATIDFHDKVYRLCTICSIVDPPNVVKPHNSSYLMAGCYNLLTGFHSIKNTFYSCCRKRKVEEFGFVRRAICLESNEGTVATECKVDFMEIVDSNDESIITSCHESEITSSGESEIEDGKDDSEQVCLNVF